VSCCPCYFFALAESTEAWPTGTLQTHEEHDASVEKRGMGAGAVSSDLTARELELVLRVRELEQRVADLSTNETRPGEVARIGRLSSLGIGSAQNNNNLDKAALGSFEREHFIVAIGASAGGQASLLRFLSVFPPGTGCSIVICQHLSSNFPSVMVQSKRRKKTVKFTNNGFLLSGRHPSWRLSSYGPRSWE
jgi:chemotaxis response regulator CheB